MGVAVLGALLAASVKDLIAAGLAGTGVPEGSGDGGKSGPRTPTRVGAARGAHAYADATGQIFLISAPSTIVTLIALALMPRSELRRTAEKRN